MKPNSINRTDQPAPTPIPRPHIGYFPKELRTLIGCGETLLRRARVAGNVDAPPRGRSLFHYSTAATIKILKAMVNMTGDATIKQNCEKLLEQETARKPLRKRFCAVN